LKKNFYAAKSMIKPFDPGYQKIDMCLNFCMLYYCEDVTKCKPKGMLDINPIQVEEGHL
jgi:hypothetical protein